MASELKIQKSIEIDRPIQDVYEYLRFSKNQDNFSVWNMTDPDKKTTYKGEDGTVGFTYSWDSKNKNVGAGTQITTKLVENQMIEYALAFERPMKNTGVSKFLLLQINKGQTQVTWDFSGPTKFPMSLFKGIFQRMLGKDLEKGLENLKSVLEK